jgi:large conductance mechanosensitive channel
VAMAVYLLVKQMNRFFKAEEEAPAEPDPELQLLGEIRDLLRERAG